MSDVITSLTYCLLADLLISINSIRSHLRFSVSSLLSFKLDWFCLRSQVTCALTTLEHCTPLAFLSLCWLNGPSLHALSAYWFLKVLISSWSILVISRRDFNSTEASWYLSFTNIQFTVTTTITLESWSWKTDCTTLPLVTSSLMHNSS